MAVIFFILFIAVLASTIILYRSRPKTLRPNSHGTFQPPASVGLFDEQPRASNEKDRASVYRAHLLSRAGEGDLSALDEAHKSGDARLYSEVLDALIGRSDGRQEDFKALVSFISKSNGPRANKRLAERVIESWDRSPDRGTLVEMIHVAALADDATTYLKAVEVAARAWETSRVANLSGKDLSDLIESQYWVLDDQARSSGAGFQLKRAIADARRGLGGARKRIEAG